VITDNKNASLNILLHASAIFKFLPCKQDKSDISMRLDSIMKKLPSVFFFLLLYATSVNGQQCKNLILEGAGVRGIAYVGAIKYFEEKGLLDTIQTIGGTSAGAITALALSLGYTSAELERLIYETKLQKFNDGKFFFMGGIARMNKRFGWYRGKTFLKWLEKMIRDKTGNAEISFQEMHDRHFKDLYVTGTSLNHQKLLVFSWKTYPFMKVKDAVRISMSIPLYFEAVIIDSLGRVLQKADKNYYDITVDGGLTGNFPIAMFDSLVADAAVRIPNMQTLGLRIDTPEQIRYDSMQAGLAPIPITRFRNYVASFYSYVIENLNRGTLTREDWKRTISISSGIVGPKIRKLSPEEKDFLINNGYRAAESFFRKKS